MAMGGGKYSRSRMVDKVVRFATGRMQILPYNDLDFSVLEPGDILIVSNPTDRWYTRFTVFWSHIGIVTERGVVDAARDPRGERAKNRLWYSVQCVPFEDYAANYDILALRVRCECEKRLAAARYAESKIGAPYAPTIWHMLFTRRSTRYYSCASLMWQAYMLQGIDLNPTPFNLEFVVLPGALARSQYVEVIGRGTRYAAIPLTPGNLGVILSRCWFRYVLRCDIKMVTGGTGL